VDALLLAAMHGTSDRAGTTTEVDEREIMKEHTHDAWILGVHELPAEMPNKAHRIVENLDSLGVSEGFVLVHELKRNRWTSLDAVTFDELYEFV
jgi:hypothetical protein